jgi:hypothetical protein
MIKKIKTLVDVKLPKSHMDYILRRHRMDEIRCFSVLCTATLRVETDDKIRNVWGSRVTEYMGLHVYTAFLKIQYKGKHKASIELADTTYGRYYVYDHNQLEQDECGGAWFYEDDFNEHFRILKEHKLPRRKKL